MILDAIETMTRKRVSKVPKVGVKMTKRIITTQNNEQKLSTFNAIKDGKQPVSILRNTRKKKCSINCDGIISAIDEVKASKSKVNRAIKSMKSEDFYYEKLAKMLCNDTQKMNSKYVATDRAWWRTKTF